MEYLDRINELIDEYALKVLTNKNDKDQLVLVALQLLAKQTKNMKG